MMYKTLAPLVWLIPGLMMSSCIQRIIDADPLGKDLLGIKTPPMSTIESSVKSYQRDNAMPIPEELAETQNKNSLWQSGSKTFFKDQRARRVGDPVLVNVDIGADTATFTATTKLNPLNKDASTPPMEAKAPNLLGYENNLDEYMPMGFNPKNLVEAITNNRYHEAKNATTTRTETFIVKVSATVIQVLPNGNFVIFGRQEVRVDNEVRELVVKGIIRHEDIDPTNTIDYKSIAEARISFGGRGEISDAQRAPIGQRLFSKVSPF